jgi:hypothetical protein
VEAAANWLRPPSRLARAPGYETGYRPRRRARLPPAQRPLRSRSLKYRYRGPDLSVLCGSGAGTCDRYPAVIPRGSPTASTFPPLCPPPATTNGPPAGAAPTSACHRRSGKPSARCLVRPWPAGCRNSTGGAPRGEVRGGRGRAGAQGEAPQLALGGLRCLSVAGVPATGLHPYRAPRAPMGPDVDRWLACRTPRRHSRRRLPPLPEPHDPGAPAGGSALRAVGRTTVTNPVPAVSRRPAVVRCTRPTGPAPIRGRSGCGAPPQPGRLH